MPRKDPTSTEVFIVSGAGEFPIDMLRYDACWPASEADSSEITSNGLRRVALRHRSLFPLTPGRWNSFGWKIVERGTP